VKSARILVVVLLGTLNPTFARGDYVPTQVHWPGWRVATSEDLGGRAPLTRYSIANMFDGDPRTAWVFGRDTPVRPDTDPEAATTGHWGGRYGLSLELGRATELDGFELMNGYNKSERLFKLNNRIVEVAVYDESPYGSKPIKRVFLSDKMGWHRVSLPRRNYSQLWLTFVGVRKGPADDVCVSELRLLQHGRPVSTGLQKLYMATAGSECG
jgi:hypothetical protein